MLSGTDFPVQDHVNTAKILKEGFISPSFISKFIFNTCVLILYHACFILMYNI